jgi:ribosomal protein S12 methylthiotransferase
LRRRSVYLEKRPFAFLKIAEGCNWKCSYCAIPLIKGTLQSRSKKEILNEVKILDEQGFKELIVVGQDTSSWGRDLSSVKKSYDILTLTESMLKIVKNIRWIRFLYFHPLTLPLEFIDLLAHQQKLCKYIDLPIQHISKNVLKDMKRAKTRTQIVKTIDYIKKQSVKIALRSTVIVGYPTETKNDFSELLSFVKEVEFDRLGAFMYSKEEGTAAYKLKDHSRATKQRRFDALMGAQKQISQRKLEELVGSTQNVLIEEKVKDDLYIGRTQYDAPEIDGCVYVTSSKRLLKGSMCHAKITGALEYDLEGVYTSS